MSFVTPRQRWGVYASEEFGTQVMAEDWDIYGSQTDRWGFTRYSLAVHTPADLTDGVMAFRRAIGLADLTSQPHVSISASLYQPTDLDEVRRKVALAAGSSDRFRIQFESEPVAHKEATGWLVVVPTEPLLALREAIRNAVGELIRGGGNVNRPYRPHVTLYQSASAGEAARARQVAETFNFGEGFEASSVELVGRVGPPRGGTREIIASYSFDAA